MPAYPIIDAHLHLWDPQRFPMPWVAGNSVLNRPFGMQEYREQTQGIDIEAMVYVEVNVDPSAALGEAQWVAAYAEQEPGIQGIVAAASLEHGEGIRSHLESLVALGPRIKGVRRNLQDEPDPTYCLQPNFVRGVRMLQEFDLSFDLCIYHHQLAPAIELVRQCLMTRFILDHIAKPDIKHGTLDPWREHMRELAALPNVVCKISGLVTEADIQHWTVADLAPYVLHVLEVFGEDRVLFGGDWPVILMASSYARWVETLDTLTSHLSAHGRHKLWAENARRYYRLG